MVNGDEFRRLMGLKSRQSLASLAHCKAMSEQSLACDSAQHILPYTEVHQFGEGYDSRRMQDRRLQSRLNYAEAACNRNCSQQEAGTRKNTRKINSAGRISVLGKPYRFSRRKELRGLDVTIAMDGNRFVATLNYENEIIVREFRLVT